MSKESSGLFSGTSGSTGHSSAINSLPTNPSQLSHIFRRTSGHLVDTAKNRATLQRIANDPSLYVGTDKHGNDWYVETCRNGGQHWVSVRNGVIQNGGYNRTPIEWNPSTGLSAPTKPEGSKTTTKPTIKPKKRS
ncbi:MAG: hypothetical protein IIT58_09915 [Treponema sp.]|nr:hypothetical protein [Treponema sp.]